MPLPLLSYAQLKNDNNYCFRINSLEHWLIIDRWFTDKTTHVEAMKFLNQASEEVALYSQLNLVDKVELLEIITLQKKMLVKDAIQEINTEIAAERKEEKNAKPQTVADWPEEIFNEKIPSDKIWLETILRGLRAQQNILACLMERINALIFFESNEKWSFLEVDANNQLLTFANLEHLDLEQKQNREELKMKKAIIPKFLSPMEIFGMTPIMLLNETRLKQVCDIENKAAYSEWKKIEKEFLHDSYNSEALGYKFLENKFKEISLVSEYDLFSKPGSKISRKTKITQNSETKLQLLRIILFQMQEFYVFLDSHSRKKIEENQKILMSLVTRVSKMLRTKDTSENSENLLSDMAYAFREFAAPSTGISSHKKTCSKLLNRFGQFKVNKREQLSQENTKLELAFSNT